MRQVLPGQQHPCLPLFMEGLIQVNEQQVGTRLVFAVLRSQGGLYSC